MCHLVNFHCIQNYEFNTCDADNLNISFLFPIFSIVNNRVRCTRMNVFVVGVRCTNRLFMILNRNSKMVKLQVHRTNGRHIAVISANQNGKIWRANNNTYM